MGTSRSQKGQNMPLSVEAAPGKGIHSELPPTQSSAFQVSFKQMPLLPSLLILQLLGKQLYIDDVLCKESPANFEGF